MKAKILLLISLFFTVTLFAQKHIQIVPKKVNVGKIRVYKKAKGVYHIYNHAKKPLIIVDAEGSCGCVNVSYSRKPIPPGGSSTVIITFRPYCVGKFQKYGFLIFSLGGKRFAEQLELEGEAVKK